jgi:hypothetical protein
MNSPLALDGWLEFNRLKWAVTPHRLRFAVDPNPGSGYLEAVLYTDRRGRFCLPNGNSYIALDFHPSAQVASRISRQWVAVAGQLAAEMARRGTANPIPLPPAVDDARPWRWSQFNVALKYTLYLDFPYDLNQADQMLRYQVRKLEKRGFRVDRTTDMALVHGCLLETETHKGFDHSLTARELDLARSLLGDEHFRCYVCYTPEGEPASCCVVLHRAGGRAMLWVGGSFTRFRQSGSYQLLKTAVFADVAAAGAVGYDLAGANIPSVAEAKTKFGARLVPYFTVEGYGVRPLARWVRGWWQFTERSRVRRAARSDAPEPAGAPAVHRPGAAEPVSRPGLHGGGTGPA